MQQQRQQQEEEEEESKLVQLIYCGKNVQMSEIFLRCETCTQEKERQLMRQHSFLLRRNVDLQVKSVRRLFISEKSIGLELICMHKTNYGNRANEKQEKQRHR